MSKLQKFIFEGLPVRGALVRLTDAWQEIQSRQQQSSGQEDGNTALLFPAVSELVGEMSAAAILLHTTIKFDGTLILQIQGDGPLKLAVAEVRADMGLRATANVTGKVPAMYRIDELCNVNGQGRCAIVLDPQNRQPGQQPYQGVVPLNDEQGQPLVHLSEVIERYMQQSEQLPTHIILAADKNCAAGLLIQRLPTEGEKNLDTAEKEQMDEAFTRIATLAKSLKRDELLQLDAQDILHRLFWQEDLRLFDDAPQPYFCCSCSRERVTDMLKGLGKQEVEHIIQEQKKVEITCNFCGALYRFDAVDTQPLFADDTNTYPPTSQNLQ
jgi:Disulfide bond chaperones of the HSP33 family